jgi:hypothetical protein
MGTLVFQATLGGAVNIIGPNIANTINFTLPSADGTSGQTWTTNGSGVLSFGTLGIAGGGTGQITATAAFNALAPSQSGQSGKYLTTDGTNTSWGTNPLGTVTSVAATVPSFLSIAGSPITTSGTLAFTLSGTALPTTSGGTGLTSFTSGGVVYASSSSALATGSGLVFDASGNLGIGTTPSGNGKLVVSNSGAEQFEFRPAYASNVNKLINYNRSGAAYVSEAHDAAQYYWETSGTEQMRLTSTGLGIGTSSPSVKLDVAGAIKATNDATVSGSGRLTLGDATGNAGARLDLLGWSSSNSNWRLSSAFYGNGLDFTPSTTAGGTTFTTPAFAMASNGVLTVNSGIQFPATQSASSNANTLDDYEEGTWTPNQGSGLTVVGTFSSVGVYTKVGRQVTVYGYVSSTTTIALASLGQLCSNLPFTEGDPPYAVVPLISSDGNSGAAYVIAAQITGSSAYGATGNIKFSATYFV